MGSWVAARGHDGHDGHADVTCAHAQSCGEVLRASTCPCGGGQTQGSALGLEPGRNKDHDFIGSRTGRNCIDDDLYEMMGETRHRDPKPGRVSTAAFETARTAPAETKCAECGKRISGSAVQADGKAYHTNCFTCLWCNERLTGAYVVRGTNFLCKGCAAKDTEDSTGPSGQAAPLPAGSGAPTRTTRTTKTTTTKTTTTQRTVAPSSLSTTGGVDQLENDEFKQRIMSAEVCSACQQPVTSAGVRLDHGLFHRECFVCADCQQPFEENNVREKDGKYYHSPCWTRLFAECCAGCGEPLSGAYAKLGGKPYHKACIKCVRCQKAVSGGVMMGPDGIVCANCA